MYKLIIADDEKIIQEGLTHLIDWNSLGFEITETFSDGDEVIEYLDSVPVDVVLTDIMMTHISGVEVARYINDQKLTCKVVFITGHKDFELALKAIKYGVTDYILKPTKVDDVKKVFLKIKEELDQRFADIEFQLRVKKQWDELHPAIVERFVSSLIMGALDDKKDIQQRVNWLYPDVDVDKCSCILTDMEIRDYERYLQSKWNYSAEQFDEAVYNFVTLFTGAGYVHVIYKYRGKIRLFIIMKKYGTSQKQNTNLCETLVHQFEKEFTDIFNADISIDITQIFQNTYEVMEHQEDIIRMTERQDNADLYLHEQEKLVLTNIMMGNISSAQKIMKSILKSMAVDDMGYRIHFVVNIFSSISNLLSEKNPQLLKSIQPFIDYHTMSNITTVSEMNLYCERVFNRMKSQEGMSGQFDSNRLVKQIKEYVNQHIYEDIMLETVANEIFISTTHLSRIFKKQTGETFLQYVTRKKMEKAAQMLADPGNMIYQIGESLGYKTPRYFSKLFNNYSGYYPSEYRNQVLMMKEESDEKRQA